jgi:predicted amidohydrolase YtcJ
MKLFNQLLLLSLLLAFSACQNKESTADLIIHNGVIWIGSDSSTTVEAMAIKGDKIIATGTNDAILKLKNTSTKKIDLEGKFVTPGFIDSHIHLMTGGRSLLSVDLRDADSPEKFSQRIADFTKEIAPNEWILEGNWDHTLWGGELPKKEWIDELTPDNPVVVFRLDWHMVLANSAALKYAGIDKNTPDVEGGTIVRDENGELTGILKDNAMNLLLDKIPPMSSTQKNAAFSAAMTYFFSNGVTSVHDVDGMNKDFESFSTAKKFLAENKSLVRIYAAQPLNEWKILTKMEQPTQSEWLKIGCLKGFVDGSLGSHTAAFHNDYTDKESDKGFFINTQNDLYQWVSDADKANLHVMVHAIGDSAVHSLLDIFERVIQENGDKDRRFRIEHAQHLLPSDIDRFAKLGVIASMQPYHAIDDGRWAEAYIGSERIKTTYAFNSLLNAKAAITFGSDWAVAPASPLKGIYAAVTRRTLDDKNPNGWVPEQKITVAQALLAYTKNAAYASFDEKIKGTLEVGKLADFVILSDNIFKIAPVDINETKVLQTYIGGELMFNQDAE